MGRRFQHIRWHLPWEKAPKTNKSKEKPNCPEPDKCAIGGTKSLTLPQLPVHLLSHNREQKNQAVTCQTIKTRGQVFPTIPWELSEPLRWILPVSLRHGWTQTSGCESQSRNSAGLLSNPFKTLLLLESQFPQQQDTQLSAEFRAINNPKIYSCDISYEGLKKKFKKIACGNEGKGSALKGNKFNEEKMVPDSV